MAVALTALAHYSFRPAGNHAFRPHHFARHRGFESRPAISFCDYFARSLRRRARWLGFQQQISVAGRPAQLRANGELRTIAHAFRGRRAADGGLSFSLRDIISRSRAGRGIFFRAGIFLPARCRKFSDSSAISLPPSRKQIARHSIWPKPSRNSSAAFTPNIPA